MIQVVIVDDDPMVRKVNSMFLKKVEGFNLEKATSTIAELKKLISAKKPDLILLDVYLPKENGINFLKWLREQEIAIDIILITAENSIEKIQESFRYGVVDYLIKPFTFERFKEALNQFKDRYNRLKRNDELEQDELDKLIFSVNAFSNDEVIKGFSKYTYELIYEEIKKRNKEDFTAEDLAGKLGMSRVTVRRYLEYMENEKSVEKLIEYGKVGRPLNKYHKI
ncbi:response regulator [Clostridium sp. SHJSY1]|uniref:response regulator n=1 Tax=Clostridium sp. SHJSY1 TaxID=2942483 RepID=UPI0028749667|nr:response regulator [Clostridium sp. SHJSY1]MDS0525526.1 response regulator [Clostridium sp. SHJSY1]